MNKYTFKIKILNDCYNFKKGQLHDVQIYSVSKFHAEEKFLNNFIGSEYPLFDIIEIQEEKIKTIRTGVISSYSSSLNLIDFFN